MSAFQTQKQANAATKTLTRRVARWLRDLGAEVEKPHHNGTAAEYGGGYCFTATLEGEDYHVEIIAPYVEGDEEGDDDT